MQINMKSDPYTQSYRKENTKLPCQITNYWPCKWISYENENSKPTVVIFSKEFDIEWEDTVRVHVSADERYILYFDGNLLGRGSERGDKNNWYFESYDVHMDIGKHILTAVVWNLGSLKPWAQVTISPGFLLSPQDEKYFNMIGTGSSKWKVKKIDGISFIDISGMGIGTGARCIMKQNILNFETEDKDSSQWQIAGEMNFACGSTNYSLSATNRVLKPSTLPQMVEKKWDKSKIRFIDDSGTLDHTIPRAYHECIQSEMNDWISLLDGKDLQIKPFTHRRILIDFNDYVCIYPRLVVSGGEKSLIKIHSAESLFENGGFKGNRDEVEGKFFQGVGDMFYPDGGVGRLYESLWWLAGRYLEIEIKTEEEPLKIEQLAFIETRYPMEMKSNFSSSDQRLERIVDIGFRTLQNCMHETYMDCPYYEQLMYVGDTRIQALITYVTNDDENMAKKALWIFGQSANNHSGLINCAYPQQGGRVIPSFCLWWIAMAYDYMMYKGDREFLTTLMPTVRYVLDKWMEDYTPGGLIKTPGGWNYIDWVDGYGWEQGVPPDRNDEFCGFLNWQTVIILEMMQDLEAFMGEPELSVRAGKRSRELAETVVKCFWNQDRGLFSDDQNGKHYSEHTQCLALLSKNLDSATQQKVLKALEQSEGLAPCSIYFMHYLFEVYAKFQRTDLLIKKLSPWYDLSAKGFKTTPEGFEQSTRSDCHAWGAHYIYHYYATILGIRPAVPGFKKVHICPCLGTLDWTFGTMIHPQGVIKIEFKKEKGMLQSRIVLPDGVDGDLTIGSNHITLYSGEQYLEIPYLQ